MIQFDDCNLKLALTFEKSVVVLTLGNDFTVWWGSVMELFKRTKGGKL